MNKEFAEPVTRAVHRTGVNVKKQGNVRHIHVDKKTKDVPQVSRCNRLGGLRTERADMIRLQEMQTARQIFLPVQREGRRLY